jgi:hypothetical protein
MAKKKKVQCPKKHRNPWAVIAHFKSGAGAHESNKYSRKTKHKSMQDDRYDS